MAGTVTLTHYALGYVRRIEAACTADAADGSFPATALPAFEGRLVQLITNPGATAPTDNYDITLVDVDGADRLQGVGMNRDTANTEQAAVVFSGTALHPVVDAGETLTLTIAGNAVNSATTRIVLFYAPA
jgi:hypothetical protein